MHHVPHTGGLTNTVFTTAHSGLQIMPLNYLEGSPVNQSVNMVRVDYASGNINQVVTFRQEVPSCVISDVEDLVPGLSTYLEDSVVRKFPYDPNDPYYETDNIE
jgi:primary-amine oxidase